MRISDWSSDVCSSDLAIAAAGVFHVGDVAVDQLVVAVAERHAPKRLARRLAGGEQAVRQRVVVGEQAGMELAEGDDDGTGQGGEVDHRLGFERKGAV